MGVVGGTITEFDIGEAEGFTYSIKALSHSNTLGLGPNFETKINTLEETSIRKETITQLQALTFNAQVSLDVNYNDLGFYLVYGDLSLSELINKVGNDNIIINGKKVFKHSAVNVNADGTYSVKLTNIPS